MSTLAVIISDVHLGSPYCDIDAFMGFLAALPAGADLVMNGDVIDRWHRGIPATHAAGLEALRRESLLRRVVWVEGNHDDRYELENPVKIQSAKSYAVGKRLFASHGHDFDNIMPCHQTFIRVFRALHHFRIFLGAEPVHVAHYAKKFLPLYRVLRRHVAMNAVEYARENGFEAVTCGHTHYAEDRVVDDIRYINTGAWTEKPIRRLDVTADAMQLRNIET